jgi:hypothetical protein
MGEVVNLRRARKRNARAVAEAAAAANRTAHGIPKPERELAQARRALLDNRLDGLRRDGEADDN